jgi:hypothetical protein
VYRILVIGDVWPSENGRPPLSTYRMISIDNDRPPLRLRSIQYNKIKPVCRRRGDRRGGCRCFRPPSL